MDKEYLQILRYTCLYCCKGLHFYITEYIRKQLLRAFQQYPICHKSNDKSLCIHPPIRWSCSHHWYHNRWLKTSMHKSMIFLALFIKRMQKEVLYVRWNDVSSFNASLQFYTEVKVRVFLTINKFIWNFSLRNQCKNFNQKYM